MLQVPKITDSGKLEKAPTLESPLPQKPTGINATILKETQPHIPTPTPGIGPKKVKKVYISDFKTSPRLAHI